MIKALKHKLLFKESLPSTLIGWQEWVALPAIDLPAVKAKVDTGALTSSLHAENIEFYHDKGAPYVKFEVHPIQRNKDIAVICHAPLVGKRAVKSSSGDAEKRPVIFTSIILGKQQWEIELNLTKRDYMGFRMLLGRNAMAGHIIIDPSKRCLHRTLNNKNAKILY